MHVCMHLYVNIVYTCVDAYVSICTCTHVFANVVSVYACMAAWICIYVYECVTLYACRSLCMSVHACVLMAMHLCMCECIPKPTWFTAGTILAIWSRSRIFLEEKLLTPIAFVNPNCTHSSMAVHVLGMSKGCICSTLGGFITSVENFRGKCMRYKSKYSSFKALFNNIMWFTKYITMEPSHGSHRRNVWKIPDNWNPTMDFKRCSRFPFPMESIINGKEASILWITIIHWIESSILNKHDKHYLKHASKELTTWKCQSICIRTRKSNQDCKSLRNILQG